MAVQLVVLLLQVCSCAEAQPLRIFGVEKVPLLFPPGVANWLNLEDVPRGGPLGVYFDTLLSSCGYEDGFNFANWTSSGRTAEFAVVSGSFDAAFPIARQWQTARIAAGYSSGDVYYVPILSSPGTTILVLDSFTPMTIAQAIVNLDTGTILVTVLCAAVVAGVLIWFLDQFDSRTQFPPDFFEGIFCGLYWAIVSMASVGYGDFVPKTKLARLFSVFFLLLGVILIAMLQSIVTSNLAATRNVTPLQKAADILNGQNVGAVASSIEEWRMRSRGANVTLYASIEAAMNALVGGDRASLHAVAVDTLAAGLITNTLGDSVVRISGRIEDHVTYGIVLHRRVAELSSSFPGLTLAQCLSSLVHVGPMKYDALTFFRPYAVNLQFAENADVSNMQEQADVAYTAMVQAAIILPLSTFGFLLCVFYFNRSWDRRFASADKPFDSRSFPSASRLPPMARSSVSD